MSIGSSSPNMTEALYRTGVKGGGVGIEKRTKTTTIQKKEKARQIVFHIPVMYALMFPRLLSCCADYNSVLFVFL